MSPKMACVSTWTYAQQMISGMDGSSITATIARQRYSARSLRAEVSALVMKRMWRRKKEKKEKTTGYAGEEGAKPSARGSYRSP